MRERERESTLIQQFLVSETLVLVALLLERAKLHQKKGSSRRQHGRKVCSLSLVKDAGHFKELRTKCLDMINGFLLACRLDCETQRNLSEGYRLKIIKSVRTKPIVEKCPNAD